MRLPSNPHRNVLIKAYATLAAFLALILMPSTTFAARNVVSPTLFTRSNSLSGIGSPRNEPEVDYWAGKAQMPIKSADLTAAAYNGKLYIFGGYRNGASDVLNLTYEYKPATNTWTSKANMPTARWGEIAIESGGRIYVFGGAIDCSETGARVNEVYDPQTDSWTSRNPIPSSLGHQGLMGVNYSNKIHLFYRSSHYEYDPTTDTYTQKANLPTERTWGTAATINTGSLTSAAIYVIGGFAWANQQATNVNEAYSPVTDSWSTKSAAPISRWGTTRENPVIDGLIYITHGLDGTNFHTETYAYDPTTNTWSQKSSALQARDGVAGGVINNKLYVVGGRADFGACSSGPHGLPWNEEYNP